MNNFIRSCRWCLKPRVIIPTIAAIGALIYFVPIIGIASLITFLPIIGCTIMCGAMVFFMRGNKPK
jgi:hypothetical protein